MYLLFQAAPIVSSVANIKLILEGKNILRRGVDIATIRNLISPVF